jgi:hypothetical protein
VRRGVEDGEDARIERAARLGDPPPFGGSPASMVRLDSYDAPEEGTRRRLRARSMIPALLRKIAVWKFFRRLLDTTADG